MTAEAMRLLIALDDPSGFEGVVSDLKRAGIPRQVEAVVLSVADVLLPSTGTPADEHMAPLVARQIDQARARAMQAVEHARAVAGEGQRFLHAAFPHWTVHAEAVADSPAWAIVRRAEEFKADLIVAGSRNRSAFERLTLGSVSHSVLHNATTSVRIWRGAARPENAPVCVVVGEDGSENAQATIAGLAARDWPEGTTVHLVTAVDAVVAMTAMSRAHGHEGDWIKELNERCAPELRAAGLVVTPVVVQGDPRSILLGEAERLNADCIVVGARGVRGIKRLLLGSVSTAIATGAHCSVEVVRC